MPNSKLVRWQRITAATLFTGYVGYYVCRSNLSVCAKLVEAEFDQQGVTKDDIGMVVSAGVTLYALGKLTNGILADYVGGRTMFLLGMGASIVCTLLLGLSQGFVLFGVLWSANRFVQSTGWVAMVKTVSRWFPIERHASVMGFISLSYLFGDSLVKLYLGALLSIGERADGPPLKWFAEWRPIFFVAAATMTLVAIGVFRLLRTSPNDVGEPEPAAHPANVFGSGGNSAVPVPLRELLAPLLASPMFWVVCCISCGLTLIRETFNFWTPTYLNEATGLDIASAATYSSLVPLSGGISAIVGGKLLDRFQGKHGRVLVPSVALLTLALALLAAVDVRGRPELATALLCVVAFFLIAPYSFLAGVIALDIGGKRGSSTSSGMIDSAGYVGAILSGYVVARIASQYGWSTAFGWLAAASALTGVLTVGYWVMHERQLALAITNAQKGSPDGVSDSREP
jgi:MFS transporter, OPA family, glycerol-3-phosphate transporter